MNITASAITNSYQCNEYLIVLNPNEDLTEKVLKLRKEFSEKYKVANFTYYNSYIALVNFFQLELLEVRLLNQLNQIASAYSSFAVKLKDFGCFPSHTIFINIESKKQLQNLTKQLKSVQQCMTLDKENKPHFLQDPGLPLAMKLLPWQYEQGWLNYSKRGFTGFFIADEMLLLKRGLQLQSDGSYLKGKYDVVQRFKFLNLHIHSRQGQLFV